MTLDVFAPTPTAKLTLERAERTLWHDLAMLLTASALILVFLNFQDYGLTHDEEVQAVYGEKLLSWYASFFTDTSAFDYLDLFWYGGLFDLVSALLNRVSPLGTYETRHLLGGMVGVAGLWGAWKLGRLAAGPRAGFLAMALLAFTPAFVGHSFNNPKDGPFAVAMLWGVHAIACAVRELPRPSARTLTGLAVALGLALSIRVGALLLLFYAGLAVLAYLARIARAGGRSAALRQMPPILGRAALALAGAYVIVAVFWPWGVFQPLNPLRALEHFSRYDIDISSLFAGSLVDATHLPASYVAGYLAVTLPEMVLAGLVVAAVSASSRRSWRGENAAVMGQLGVAALFPIFFFAVARPTAYDGIRHFLFVIPPLVVLAAVGIDRLWRLAESHSARMVRSLVAILVCAGVVQGWIMARLHPNEYIYYNALVGGVRGAYGKWEMDYWSNSMHEAVDRLSELVLLENGGMAPVDPVRVAVCGNDLSATYFYPPYLQPTATLADADFTIAFTQAECWKTWRGRPLIEIERFGAVLSVVKDRRNLLMPEAE